MRRLLLALLALGLLGASFGGPGVSKFRSFDYCVPFIERARERQTACTYSPSLQTVADSILWGTLSAFSAFRASEVSTHSLTYGKTLDSPLPSATVNNATYWDTCPSGGDHILDFAAMEDYAASVTALRTRTAPIQWVLFTRFDLMGYPEMSLPGVKQSWFVTTSAAWADRVAAITGSTSEICVACQTPTLNHCSFLYTYGTPSTNHSVQATADQVSPATTNAWKSFVYYMPHSNYSDICNVFNNGILMRLNNSEYQAWLLSRFQNIWDENKSWAWGFEFDIKWSQYMCRDPFAGRAWHRVEWALGGNYDTACTNYPSGYTMQDYYATGDTPWSAEPTAGTGGADWTDHIQGYRAIIEALKARGIPVQLRLAKTAWWNEYSPTYWTNKDHSCNYSVTGAYKAGNRCDGAPCDGTDACDFYDDPNTTTHNENDDVLEIYRSVARVWNEKPTNNADIEANAAVVADLVSHGVEVIDWNTACGQKATE